MTNGLSRSRFFNAMIFAVRDNNTFFVECDYGSPTGISIRYAVNQNWVTIESSTFVRYIITNSPQNEKHSRYNYELELTETGEALYDFYQL
ncbi:hypothetical protein KAU11_08595 [Candidatus Babeliales bacterium]|nr:hypothetical protein [Candidatus Babeliales bacterium]